MGGGALACSHHKQAVLAARAPTRSAQLLHDLHLNAAHSSRPPRPVCYGASPTINGEGVMVALLPASSVVVATLLRVTLLRVHACECLSPQYHSLSSSL